MNLFEFRLESPLQPLTGAWKSLPVAARGPTRLGISFRPLQAAAFGLEPQAALQSLLAYPFEVIRLGAYWNRIEPRPGAFVTDELDWQVDAAEKAGKQIILCVGALKTFGYPEFFVPAHYLPRPFPEHRLITPAMAPDLLKAAIDFVARIAERYQGRAGIVAWQLEHDAVDPLGVEHSWRLAQVLLQQEVRALRIADPSRPVMMNGFLPTSWLVRLSQGWQTRDQGDSLAVALQLADWVGIDYYPRHALARLGSRTLYLDGSRSPAQKGRREALMAWTRTHGQKLLISEGQSEPWETATVPSNPAQRALYSCLPEHVIGNYNDCLKWFGPAGGLDAYLFWGAEYWLLRRDGGDRSYLQAFARVVEGETRG